MAKCNIPKQFFRKKLLNIFYRFFFIFLESFGKHFDLVASKIGAEQFFSSKSFEIYHGQFYKNFDYKIDHISKTRNRKTRKIVSS